MIAVLLTLTVTILVALTVAFLSGSLSFIMSAVSDSLSDFTKELAAKHVRQTKQNSGKQEPFEQAVDAFTGLNNELVQARQAVAQAIATEKQLEQQLEKNVQQAATWDLRGMMAIDQRNEALAEQAFQRKKQYLVAASELEVELTTSQQVTTKLRDQLSLLEIAANKVEQRRASLEHRHNLADAKILFNKHFAKLLAAYAEAQNKAAEEKLHGIIDQMPAGLMVVNKLGLILAVNPQIEKMLGQAASSICESSSANHIFVNTGDKCLADRLDELSDNSIYTTAVLTADGSLCPVEITVSKIESGDFIICVINSGKKHQL